MFIKVRRNSCQVLIPIDQIALVEPLDGGHKVAIKSVSGMTYLWDCSLDQAQEALIDNAAQATAPIASNIPHVSKDAARYQWLKKQARLEGRDGGYCGVYTFPHIVQRDGRKVNHHDLDAAIDAEINSTNC